MGAMRVSGIPLVAIAGTVTPDPLPPAPRDHHWVGIITEIRSIVPVDHEGGRMLLAGMIHHEARVVFCLERIPQRRASRRKA